jgi:hypothetical protein
MRADHEAKIAILAYCKLVKREEEEDARAL